MLSVQKFFLVFGIFLLTLEMIAATPVYQVSYLVALCPRKNNRRFGAQVELNEDPENWSSLESKGAQTSSQTNDSFFFAKTQD